MRSTLIISNHIRKDSGAAGTEWATGSEQTVRAKEDVRICEEDRTNSKQIAVRVGNSTPM